MSRKVKYSAEEKVSAVQKYLDGKESMRSIARELNIDFQAFKLWVSYPRRESGACRLGNQTTNLDNSLLK